MSDETEEEETEEAPQEEPEPRRKPGRPSRAEGGWHPGPQYKFDKAGVNEADLVWNQLCEWLPGNKDPALPTKTPYDVMIQVRRTTPPHPSGESQPMGYGFCGSAVQGGGDTLPGQALINYIMRYYHLPMTELPATYEISFWKKGTGKRICNGRLPMMSGPDCRASMRASEQAIAGQQQTGMGWQPGPPGMAGPPGQPPMPQPPPWPAYGIGYPGGYPQPPPAPPPQQNPQMDAMMSELSYMRGALGEALSAAREGRQPNIPPPPPVVTPQPPAGDMEDRIVAKVLMALRGAGLAPTPPQPPPVTTANGLGQMMEKAITGMAETIIKTTLGAVEKNIKSGMGMGAPLDEGEAEVTTAAEKPNPEDIVPWKIAAVGANWGNGSPVQVAFDKETGDISPMGLAFANPAPAEKVMEVLNGIGNAVQDAIKNFANRPRAQAQAPAQLVGAGQPPPPPPPAVEAQGWGPPPTS